MGRTHDGLDDQLTSWIAAQHVFFVATAPSGADGHVNLSPKGYDSFRVLDPTTVAYLDLTGSGVETISHLRENGRITFMFCAFEGKPKILRLFGRGRVVLPEDEAFADLVTLFPPQPGTRSVIVAELDRIQDSCGYAVPFLAYEGERERLHEWADRKGPDGIVAYHAEKNERSIDGLPGLVDDAGVR
jgi:hypothetical protein